LAAVLNIKKSIQRKKYYTQVDGVAMDSPIAPLMADVFMNWLIHNVNEIG